MKGDSVKIKGNGMQDAGLDGAGEGSDYGLDSFWRAVKADLGEDRLCWVRP